jgi:hypothetical protein
MKARFSSFILFIVLGIQQVNAQTGYDFSYSTTTYADLVSPTIVVKDVGFDGSFHTLPIGFNFHYWGVSYSNIYVSTDAYFNFATGAYGFYPFYSSMRSNDHSSINYQLDNSGGVGKRIFKIEFKNVFFEIDVNNRDSVSFQYWLYEGSDKIELHFGNSNVDTADYKLLFGNTMGPQVALSNPTLSIFYNLKGNYSSPSMVTNPTMYTFLTGYPAAGTTYAFIPKTAGVAQTSYRSSLTVCPNPATGKVVVQLPIVTSSNTAHMMIANMSGQILKNETAAIVNSIATIDVSQLAPGTYTISIEEADTRYMSEMIVIR